MAKPAHHVQHAVWQSGLFRQPARRRGGERDFSDGLSTMLLPVAAPGQVSSRPAAAENSTGPRPAITPIGSRTIIASSLTPVGDFAIHFVDGFRIPADRPRRAGISSRRLWRIGFRYRAFQQRQLFTVAFHQVGKLIEHRFTLAGEAATSRPRLKRAARRSDSAVDIGLLPRATCGERLLGGRGRWFQTRYYRQQRSIRH